MQEANCQIDWCHTGSDQPDLKSLPLPSLCSFLHFCTLLSSSLRPNQEDQTKYFFRLSFKPTADVILYVPSSWFWKRIDCIVHVMFVGLFTAQREPYLVSSLYVCGWNEFDLRCVRSARCCMRERIFFIFDFQPSEAICMENLPNVSWSKWILI